MKKTTKLLTAVSAAVAASMSIATLVNASVIYSNSKYKQIIDDIGMTSTLTVADTYASGSVSVNDSNVTVSVSMYGSYTLNGLDKSTSNGNGSPSSYASITLSNGNSVTGYGKWTQVTADYKAYYWAGDTTTDQIVYKKS